MGAAVQSTSYEGTVIRIQSGKAEALKVVHTVNNGVVFEKVVAQEGDALEIIRNGTEVQRILPGRQSVVVEKWDDQSTIFSTLPTSDIRFVNEYDVAIDRNERIAGREAVVLAIRPHDHYRYAHWLWLDAETSFPLQTQLVNAGEVIEQVKFADISINQKIDESALAPTYSTDQFTWFTQSSAHKGTDVDSQWVSNELPAGFEAVSTHEETMPGSDASVTHILFSDGLANVSVFIEARRPDSVAGLASMGSSNSYCVAFGDFEITAIGEVPAITVKQIATSMKKR
jgi:sigma-E factor negative regulatory protein RseB